MTPEIRNALRSRNARDLRLTVDQSKRFTRAMDQSFRAQWRSGPISVLIHGLTLVMTYTLMARAIASDTLSFGYILLPWIGEYLLIAWIGVLLSRTWVKEPVFVAVSGSIGIALGWTIALLTPYVLVLGWQELFGLAPDAGGFSVAWERFVDSGVVWACAAVLIGLLLDTFRDVSSWRGSDAPFVWPATHRFGVRFAALLAVCLALPFVLWSAMAVLWVLASLGIGFEAGESVSGGVQLAWLVFFMFVAADLLVLVVATWLHRRELRAARASSGTEVGT